MYAKPTKSKHYGFYSESDKRTIVSMFSREALEEDDTFTQKSL